MPRRWREHSAFRADPSAVPAFRPTRTQSTALLAALVLVAGAVAAASYVIRPDKARAFDLLHGSLYIDDFRGPVAIDLASAKPTVRINDAPATVNADGLTQLTVVPLESGTLLLNTATGEFNMIDNTGFVVKHDGGVPLPKRTGPTSAVGLPAEGDFSFIEQTGASGTSVFLVSTQTVTSAVKAATVKPRAFIAMKKPATSGDGSAATMGDSLWLLTGSSTGPRTVRELSLPPNSSTGATLRNTNHGTVTGPAALGSAAGRGNGTVGLAEPDRIELFTGNRHRTVPFTAPAGVDRILPASDQDGRLWFLMHGSSGWSVVSVNADGSGLRRPTLLTGIPGTATLAEPAQSRGALYLVDRGSGVIYRVDATSATSVASYPLAEQNGRPIEQPKNYSDATVVARESRVIVNAPSLREALAIFSDRSHSPVPIEKGAGVPVSGVGTAEALALSHTKQTKPNGSTPPNPPKNNAPAPPPPTTNDLRCAKSGQAPHIPSITGEQAGARSVQLEWTYPIIDRDDCLPQTYLLSITPADAGTPNPGPVPSVTGTSATITGLYPSSRYWVTVTAYIGKLTATSGRVQVTTGPEGPPPPPAVRVMADAEGNWDLSFSAACTDQRTCVPATAWTVIPSVCDGLGVSTPPPDITISGDPTSKRQPTVQYPGSADLLGRGLSFRVEGVGQDQTVGAPSSSTPCATSWSPPVPTALTLSASQPATTALGGSTTTTVSLDLGTDATRDVGGLGATIALTLSGPAGPQTKQIHWTGKSAHVSALFAGVHAGARYSATATVTPPGPAGHSVAIPEVEVTTRADWPSALGITSASCPRVGIGLTCDLTVHIGGLQSSAANGEKFDLVDSMLACGTTTRTLTLTDFDPSQTPVTLDNLSQLNQLLGNCTVTIKLMENAGSPAPLVFGGTESPTISSTVDLGTPARSGIGHDDLDVSWGNSAVVDVSYDPSLQPKIDDLTKNWSEEVDAPDGTSCGSSSSAEPTDLPVDTSCVNQHGGDSGQWTVTIGYQDTIDGKAEGPFTYHLDGPVPGYQECDPAAFTATWQAAIADGVLATYQGTDPGAIAGCSKWQYTLLDPTGTSCGNNTGPPPTDGTGIQLLLTCDTPPSDGWTVEVDYQDTAGDPQTVQVAVDGTPPTS